MKKKYLKPAISVMTVSQDVVLAATSIDVDSGGSTPEQHSKANHIEDDEWGQGNESFFENIW